MAIDTAPRPARCGGLPELIIARAAIKGGEHAGMHRKFGEAGREQGAFEKFGKADDFTPACIILDDELDVIRPLHKGQVADIVDTGLKPQAADLLAIDHRLHRRAAGEGETAVPCRLHQPQRIDDGIDALRRKPRHLWRSRKTPPHGAQIPRRPADQPVPIIEHQPRAFAHKFAAQPATAHARLILQHKPANPHRAVEQGAGAGQPPFRPIPGIIGETADVEIGAEGCGRRKIPTRGTVEAAQLNRRRRAGCGGNINRQADGRGIIADRVTRRRHLRQWRKIHPRQPLFQIGNPLRRQPRAQGHDQRFPPDADAVIRGDAKIDLAQLERPVAQRSRKRNGAPRRVQAHRGSGGCGGDGGCSWRNHWSRCRAGRYRRYILRGLRKAMVRFHRRCGQRGKIRTVRHFARMERGGGKAADRQRDQRSAQPHGAVGISGWWA